jgi:hypothetical protein
MLENGQRVHRHVNQLRGGSHRVSLSDEETRPSIATPVLEERPAFVPDLQAVTGREVPVLHDDAPIAEEGIPEVIEEPEIVQEPRRSARTRKAPARFKDFEL